VRAFPTKLRFLVDDAICTATARPSAARVARKARGSSGRWSRIAAGVVRARWARSTRRSPPQGRHKEEERQGARCSAHADVPQRRRVALARPSVVSPASEGRGVSGRARPEDNALRWGPRGSLSDLPTRIVSRQNEGINVDFSRARTRWACEGWIRPHATTSRESTIWADPAPPEASVPGASCSTWTRRFSSTETGIRQSPRAAGRAVTSPSTTSWSDERAGRLRRLRVRTEPRPATPLPAPWIHPDVPGTLRTLRDGQYAIQARPATRVGRSRRRRAAWWGALPPGAGGRAVAVPWRTGSPLSANVVRRNRGREGGLGCPERCGIGNSPCAGAATGLEITSASPGEPHAYRLRGLAPPHRRAHGAEDDLEALMATIACEVHLRRRSASTGRASTRSSRPAPAEARARIRAYTAVLVIPFDRGVCGACARTDAVQIVSALPDVDAFPPQNAALIDPGASIVLPVRDGTGRLLGVFIDIDSDRPAPSTTATRAPRAILAAQLRLAGLVQEDAGRSGSHKPSSRASRPAVNPHLTRARARASTRGELRFARDIRDRQDLPAEGRSGSPPRRSAAATLRSPSAVARAKGLRQVPAPEAGGSPPVRDRPGPRAARARRRTRAPGGRWQRRRR
jgi:GAF domain-containing protein